MLRPEFFDRVEVQPGTLLMFRHVLPHAGTRHGARVSERTVAAAEVAVSTASAAAAAPAAASGSGVTQTERKGRKRTLVQSAAPADSPQLRVVLFDMVVDAQKRPNAEEQHFVWQRIRKAFTAPKGRSKFTVSAREPMPLEYLASVHEHGDLLPHPLDHEHSATFAHQVLRAIEQRKAAVEKYLTDGLGHSPHRK